MARVRKIQPSLESTFFSTPEQKVMRLLVSEPTTVFTPRTISSKLKGVRGLGGVEGIMRILGELQGLGLVDFVDNNRAVRLHDDNSTVQMLKRLAAICDLESLRGLLAPISTKGVLHGSRAAGRAHTDSEYDLFVVTRSPDEVRDVTGSHPLGKSVKLTVWTPEMHGEVGKRDPKLAASLEAGIVLWGSTW